MDIRIKRIQYEGFKGQKELRTIDFEGRFMEIIGDNFTGKTTVGDVIAYLLQGTGIDGKANAEDRMMNKGSEELRIIGILEIDGQEHEIERSVSRILKGKAKTPTNETTILVDRMKATQARIDELIGPRKHFLAAFLPDYFCSLEPKEARSQVIELLPIPREEEVKAALQTDEPHFFELLKDVRISDPNVYLQKQTTELAELEKQKTKSEGAIEELELALKETDIPDPIEIDRTELDSTIETIKSIEAAKPQLIPLEPLQAERSRLLNEYQSLQGRLVFEEKIIEHTCSACGQVDKINLNASQEAENARIVEQMKGVKEKGQQAAEGIKKAEEENKQRIQTFNDANAGTLQELRSKQQQLEASIVRIQEHNMRAKLARENYDRAAGRIQEVRQEVADLVGQFIPAANERIKAAKAFAMKQVELQVAGIQKHLQRVTIKLFDVVKSTGEIKPTFKLEYDGKEYRLLSKSEQIRCGLEITQAIRILTGRNYPVFVDDGESITHLRIPETQILLTRVVAGAPGSTFDVVPGNYDIHEEGVR